MEVLRWHVETQLQAPEQQASDLLFRREDGGLRSDSSLKKACSPPWGASSVLTRASARAACVGRSTTWPARRRPRASSPRESRGTSPTALLDGHPRRVAREHRSRPSAGPIRRSPNYRFPCRRRRFRTSDPTESSGQAPSDGLQGRENVSAEEASTLAVASPDVPCATARGNDSDRVETALAEGRLRRCRTARRRASSPAGRPSERRGPRRASPLAEAARQIGACSQKRLPVWASLPVCIRGGIVPRLS